MTFKAGCHAGLHEDGHRILRVTGQLGQAVRAFQSRSTKCSPVGEMGKRGWVHSIFECQALLFKVYFFTFSVEISAVDGTSTMKTMSLYYNSVPHALGCGKVPNFRMFTNDPKAVFKKCLQVGLTTCVCILGFSV